jgi:hypothetical protein
MSTWIHLTSLPPPTTRLAHRCRPPCRTRIQLANFWKDITNRLAALLRLQVNEFGHKSAVPGWNLTSQKWLSTLALWSSGSPQVSPPFSIACMRSWEHLGTRVWLLHHSSFTGHPSGVSSSQLWAISPAIFTVLPVPQVLINSFYSSFSTVGRILSIP